MWPTSPCNRANAQQGVLTSDERCLPVPVQGETGEVYNIGTEKERTVKEVRDRVGL